MRKHLSKTLGLSLLAALSLMAFAVSSAQAGEIQVGGSTTLAAGASFNGEQIGSGTLLVKALSIEILCEKGTYVANVTNPGPPLATFSATLTFSKCKVFPINAAGELTSKEALPCIVEEPIVAKGNGEVVLHEGDSYLLAKSAEGVPFTTIKFSGEECTLPLKNEVKGSQAIKVLTGDLNLGPAVVEPELEASDAIQELLKDELLFGKNKSFLMGKGKVKVSAPLADVGKTIGVK